MISVMPLFVDALMEGYVTWVEAQDRQESMCHWTRAEKGQSEWREKNMFDKTCQRLLIDVQ